MTRATNRKWKERLKAAGRRLALAGLLACGTPGLAAAQSAIIYGSLSNFDISNDTGQICHGFEVKMDGVDVSQYGGSFTANRYGNPTVSATPTGIAVTWKSPQDSVTGAWQTRTLQHTVPWFSGQCYQWVAGTYENGGCEHFGTYTIANPTKVTSRWLCEDSTNHSSLVAVDPPTAVPYASYWVVPPVQANNPPQLVAEIEAPEPAEAPELYGDAQWTRTYVAELQRPLSLDELMADNIVVPGNLAQLESDYQILQDEPASGGNGNRRRHRNQGNIEPTTRAVVRRIEVYAFAGQYDPVTHEALCADLTCTAPAPEEIGELLDVQMTAANVQPDALLLTKAGNGTIESGDRLLARGNKCAALHRGLGCDVDHQGRQRQHLQRLDGRMLRVRRHLHGDHQWRRQCRRHVHVDSENWWWWRRRHGGRRWRHKLLAADRPQQSRNGDRIAERRQGDQLRQGLLGEVCERDDRDADGDAAGRSELPRLGRRLLRHGKHLRRHDERQQVGSGELQQIARTRREWPAARAGHSFNTNGFVTSLVGGPSRGRKRPRLDL